MLERELSQLVSQLGSTRGDAKSFFAFANTVATRRFGALDRFHTFGETGFVSDDTEQSALVAQSMPFES